MRLYVTPSRVTHKATTVETFSTKTKWRTFVYGLIFVVALEIVLISYAGIQTRVSFRASQLRAANGTAAPAQTTQVPPITELPVAAQPYFIIQGWLEGKKKQEQPNESVSAETFLKEYELMCDHNFLPKPMRANVIFKEIFDAIIQLEHGGSRASSLLSSYDVRNLPNKTAPVCPCVPNTLVGSVNVTFDAPPMGQLELWHTELQDGGYFEPPDCLARHSTAVIIPFRDREEHLQILLNVLHPLLQRQKINYRIFVIEQGVPEVFNKAAMMNVGFTEAAKMADFDCYVFHDVDMIPEDDRNFYTCMPYPRHVGSHCDKFDYQVPYADIFGGVTAFTDQQFKSVNGFSNAFYGWGGEDDDMRRRIRAGRMNIVRFPGSVSRYTMIKHGPDRRNPYNTKSGIAWKYRPSYYSHDGLTSLEYSIARREFRTLFTWILAEIPPTANFKTMSSSKAPRLSDCVLNLTILPLLSLMINR